MENEEKINNKKKKVIILSVIAVILFALIVILSIKLLKPKSVKDNKENENIVANETTENVIEENIANENVINEIIEEKEENKKEETKVYKSDNTPVADPTQEIDKQTFQKEKSNEEKAVEIVKNDWGNDSKVRITYTGTKDDNGIYYVQVIKDTYLVKMYKVNVANGTFETE